MRFTETEFRAVGENNFIPMVLVRPDDFAVGIDKVLFEGMVSTVFLASYDGQNVQRRPLYAPFAEYFEGK